MNQKQSTEQSSRPARFRVGFVARPAFLAWFAVCVFAVSFFFSPAIFSQAVPESAARAGFTPEVKELEAAKKADKVTFAASMHPWGNFEPGAWRLSKTCTETFASDVSSNNITCTDNYITLQKVGAAELTLMSESVLNLAGKNIKMEPQELRRGFHGLDPAEFKKFKTLPPQSLVVDGQPVPCEVVEFEFSDEKVRKTVKLWIHQSRLPYVFRKEQRVFQAKDGTEEEFTVTEISSMNQQVVALGRIFQGYQSRVESRFPTRTVSSVMLSSPQVPGGVVSRVSREKDLSGHTIQVATTELADFGRTPEERQNEVLRNSPMQVARRTAFRPTVPAGAVAGRAKTLELTLNFSQETAVQRELPVSVSESYDYIRFRNRLWKNRGKTVHVRTSGGPGQDVFQFTEAEITVAGPAMADSSVPGMITISRNAPQQEDAAEPEQPSVSIFARPDSQTAVTDGKASRSVERRSPLYQLRKKDIRKRQRTESKVAMLAPETCPEQYQDENTGFIDLSVVYDGSEQPSEKNMPRGSWRRHWRAAIFGENAER